MANSYSAVLGNIYYKMYLTIVFLAFSCGHGDSTLCIDTYSFLILYLNYSHGKKWLQNKNSITRKNAHLSVGQHLKLIKFYSGA